MVAASSSVLTACGGGSDNKSSRKVPTVSGSKTKAILVGTKADLVKIMIAAKWSPADALSLKSSLEIAVDAVFKRPDPDAPVSNLYLFGRKEDLAFEQPVGDSPRHRHHVRFWESDKLDADGRPFWLGSGRKFNSKVGLFAFGDLKFEI